MKKNHFHERKAKIHLRICAVLVSIAFLTQSESAAASNWLAFDLGAESNAYDQSYGSDSIRENAIRIFNDDTNLSVTVTQSIRSMMDPYQNQDHANLVDAMLTEEAIDAKTFLSQAPHAKALVAREKYNYECELDAVESTISCAGPSRTAIKTGTAESAPRDLMYDRRIISGAVLSASDQKMMSENNEKTNEPNKDSIELKSRPDGLLSVDGRVVKFAKEAVSKSVFFGANLKVNDWSVFVRDESVAYWDGVNKLLTSKKIGETEMFVVTPGRISIIPIVVGENKLSNPKVANKQGAAPSMELVQGLATLDGLDRAAGRDHAAASFGDGQNVAPYGLADLVVSDDVTQLGTDGLSASGRVVRAKAKVSFEGLRLKFVDERSVVAGSAYPVGGLQVKVAGSDHVDLTDARGELELRDVPSNSRLLVEVSDSRGFVMPQVSEVVSERESSSNSNAVQTIRVRRFSSLDLIARSGGVVQDMRKSSLCGVVQSGSTVVSDVAVALDVFAQGPFYFNSLGLVDLKRFSTGPNGQFCFFNVDPGPVVISMMRSTDNAKFSGVLSIVGGRHSEEVIDLNDARHVATTVTSIAGANEQLGSDVLRANRRDLLDQVDMFAIGSGHMMVPIGRGMLSTPTRVLALKGRIWTVSATSDFETVVQSVASRAPTNRQIATLIPNGFVTDMAVLANTTHDLDLGSVLVEHGHLAGHGNDPVKFRLIDSFGRDTGDGWYFSDNPVTKAVFFNVPPGVYAVIVETSDGHWISSDTTIVYSESISFVKTGSPLEKISSPVARNFSN